MTQYDVEYDLVYTVTERAGDHYGNMPNNNDDFINEVVSLYKYKQNLKRLGKGQYDAVERRETVAQVEDFHINRR